jgi:nucleoside 2-deoxyribosyltransferase
MKRKAFISGPIQGVESEQAYRHAIREICISSGYEVIDPWEREKKMYRENEERWWDRVPPADFIRRDLEDVERCDVLVAYFPKLSAGTCMELFYAKLRGKRTICICEIPNPSQWLVFHSDVMIKKIEELEAEL